MVSDDGSAMTMLGIPGTSWVLIVIWEDGNEFATFVDFLLVFLRVVGSAVHMWNVLADDVLKFRPLPGS